MFWGYEACQSGQRLTAGGRGWLLACFDPNVTREVVLEVGRGIGRGRVPDLSQNTSPAQV